MHGRYRRQRNRGRDDAQVVLALVLLERREVLSAAPLLVAEAGMPAMEVPAVSADVALNFAASIDIAGNADGTVAAAESQMPAAGALGDLDVQAVDRLFESLGTASLGVAPLLGALAPSANALVNALDVELSVEAELSLAAAGTAGTDGGISVSASVSGPLVSAEADVDVAVGGTGISVEAGIVVPSPSLTPLPGTPDDPVVTPPDGSPPPSLESNDDIAGPAGAEAFPPPVNEGSIPATGATSGSASTEAPLPIGPDAAADSGAATAPQDDATEENREPVVPAVRDEAAVAAMFPIRPATEESDSSGGAGGLVRDSAVAAVAGVSGAERAGTAEGSPERSREVADRPPMVEPISPLPDGSVSDDVTGLERLAHNLLAKLGGQQDEWQAMAGRLGIAPWAVAATAAAMAGGEVARRYVRRRHQERPTLSPDGTPIPS